MNPIPLECPWTDCNDFKPLPEYKDQKSAELDLVNHIQLWHSFNSTARKLITEQSRNKEEMKSILHKHRWHDRWYDWLCIDCGAVSCDKVKIRGYILL
ncbi:MAG TPA: hypothetical protein VF220_05415 [Nitrososphaeraceae archaeon]